jgi:hypothetical protein
MSEKLQAHLEARSFGFFVTERKPNEITIDMYNTPYILVNKDGQWKNHYNNKMEMSQSLINAVIAAIN